MEQEQNPRTSDRKTIEKNRRNHMKALYSMLHSLIPHHPASSAEAVTLLDQIEEATTYIKKLEKELEQMKEKRNSKMMRVGENPMSSSTSSSSVGMIRSPKIEIHEMGSALKIVLTTGLDCQRILNQIIRLVHEEGAEVVNASFCTVGDTVFHTIHSKRVDRRKNLLYVALLSNQIPWDSVPKRAASLCLQLFKLESLESGLASCGAARIAEKLKKSFNDAGSF